MSVTVMWLIAGVVLFFAEMGIPGIGIMFAGCGALTVGMMLNFSLLPAEDTVLQALVFVSSTAAWSIILWKPIQKFRSGKSRSSYSNMIGETATVSSKGISKTKGEVVWSGTIMQARLVENSPVDTLDEGTLVIIQDITGNILTVAPK